MELVIRNASVGDADAIGSVVVRAWQVAYRGIMPDDYLDGLRAEQRAAMWQRVLADLGPDRWVRRPHSRGRLSSGSPLVAPSWPTSAMAETGELYAINLDPDHWAEVLAGPCWPTSPRVLPMSATALLCCGSPRGTSGPAELYQSEGWTAEDPAP